MTVTGRLLHGGRTETPLARGWVVLHEVAMGGRGGPVDSARSDARGGYTLTIARPDTGAVYIVSSRYQGIAYFSEPLTVAAAGTVRARPIVVYDTSSSGPAVAVSRRLVTIARPKRGGDGTRDVLELLELKNPGTETRIAVDTLAPTWAGAIPHPAIQFQVGQGDLAPEAVTRRGDTVAAFAPIPPGEARQLSYAYVLPADVRHAVIPVDQPTAEVDLLLEDTAAAVTAPGLERLGVQEIEQRRFARYRARHLAARTSVVITLPGGGFRAQMLVPVVVLLAALALVAGLVVAIRRRPPA